MRWLSSIVCAGEDSDFIVSVDSGECTKRTEFEMLKQN